MHIAPTGTTASLPTTGLPGPQWSHGREQMNKWEQCLPVREGCDSAVNLRERRERVAHALPVDLVRHGDFIRVRSADRVAGLSRSISVLLCGMDLLADEPERELDLRPGRWVGG